jgi:hypothetical protein
MLRMMMGRSCLLILVVFGVTACQSSTAVDRPGEPAQKASNPNWKPPPPTPTGPIVCTLDPKDPGPMMRGGRAHVKIYGKGTAIDVRDVPAICGPLYNVNASSLGVVAGDGLLFRTCLPEGLIELSADARVAGKQVVHTGLVKRGTDMIFAKHLGSSYSTAGAAGDEIVVSPDFWKVEARVELREIEGDGVLRASVTYDCSDTPINK